MIRNTLVSKGGEVESNEEDNERKDCAGEKHQWDPHGHDGLSKSQNVRDGETHIVQGRNSLAMLPARCWVPGFLSDES